MEIREVAKSAAKELGYPDLKLAGSLGGTAMQGVIRDLYIYI